MIPDHLYQQTIPLRFTRSISAHYLIYHQATDSINLSHSYSLRHEHSGFLTANAFEDLRKDLLADVHIQCRNRIIHQHDLCSGVDGSGEAYPCFLSTGEIYALCTDLRHITSRQNF